MAGARAGGRWQADQIVQKATLAAIHIYQPAVLGWVRDIKRMDRFSEVAGLRIRVPEQYQVTSSRALVCGYAAGRLRTLKEIEYQLARQRVSRFAENGSGDWDFLTSTFDEALQWFKGKGIMSSREWEALTNEARAISFRVAGIDELRLVAKLKASIQSAMDEGMTFRQWAKGVDEVFSAYGVTPISPHHLETVFRTNTFSAFNIAKHEAVMDDDNTEGLEYSAILDGRERPEHGAMNGFTAAKDDPVWNRWYPPPPESPYNCRCTVIPVTLEYMQRTGRDFDTELPDDVGPLPDGVDIGNRPWNMADYAETVRQAYEQAKRDAA
jgi:SPP1 gp7 family putative phage head morphogenesis protein